MADNVELDPGSGGAIVATDDVSSVQHQLVKVEFGADGAATMVSTSNPLPVSATNLEKAEDAAHSSGDKGVMALGVRKDTAAALAGTDGDYQPFICDANGAMWVVINGLQKAEDAAHSSGDLGVMALAVRKDSAGTLVSAEGDYSALLTDANGNLWTFLSGTTSLTPGTAAANLGKAEDAAHSSGDVGVMMLAVRQDSAAALAGTDGDYMPPIVNATGHLYTTVNGLIPGTAATSLGKAEDAAHTSGDTGVMLLGVRKDSATALAGTDGDYQPAIFDANGAMWVIISGSSSLTPGTGAANLGKAEDAAHSSGDTGVMLLGVRKDSAAALAGTDGDYQPAIFDANGAMWVYLNGCASLTPGTAAANLGKAEDAAHSSGDTGVMMLGVRKDSAAALAGTDGDYQPPIMDANGAMWVFVNGTTTITPGTGASNLGKAEDAAHTSADVGVMALSVRQDTQASLCGTDGDYAPTQLNSLGAQRVQDVPHTSGGLSTSMTISAATTNGTNVKNTAGMLYNIQVFNLNAAARYLKLYNMSSAPTVGTDTPVKVIMIPGNTAGSGVVIAIDKGLAFSTGISFALTTGIANSDTGAVAANEIVVNLDYK